MDRHEPLRDRELSPRGGGRRTPIAFRSSPGARRSRERTTLPWDPEALEAPPQAASSRDPLRQYLSEIGGIPVLTAAEEADLARRIRAASQELQDLLAAVPYTARALHRRWTSLRSEGRVTGLLSASHHAADRGDRSQEVDALCVKIGRLLARRDACFETPEPGRAELRRIDASLGRRVRELEPRSDLVDAMLEELREYQKLLAARSGKRSAPLRRRIEREIGLDPAGLRTLLGDASAAQQRWRQARDTFVRHNLRLVVQQAKAFRHMGVSFLDLIQEGNTGLLRAVEKFDERHGNRFSTYGVWWIQQSCIRAIQGASRTVRIPSHVHDQMRHYRRAVEALEGKYGREPTASELGRRLGMSREEVEALGRLDARTLSLDEPISGTDSLTLADRLEDDGPGAEEKAQQARLEEIVSRLVDCLEPRERLIVRWRFGLERDEDRTLQEIGDDLGLSRERVRQIEKGALRKLRNRVGANELEALLH